jgi:hypothetical protein
VLRTGRDFDCHPPAPTGRALGVCTGPNFRKRKKERPDRKDFFLSNKDCEEELYPDSLVNPKSKNLSKSMGQ